MVDEFQDTNPLQLELLDLLGRGNVFVVGDELQSIYGFRHADVEVFRAPPRGAARRAGTAADAGDELPRARPRSSRRSTPRSASLHGADSCRSWPGRDEPPAHEPRVELLLTDAAGVATTQRDADARRRGGPRRSARRWRPRRGWSPSACATLVDAGECAARRGRGAAARCGRPAGLRARARGRRLRDARRAAGAAGGAGARSLRPHAPSSAALANPRDEVALLGVLASPLVGLSADALALLAMARAQRAAAALWGVPGAVVREAGRAALAARLPPRRPRAARGVLPVVRGRARATRPRLGLDELLERAVARSGYDLHVLGAAGGARGGWPTSASSCGSPPRFEARHGRDVRGFVDLARAELEADARRDRRAGRARRRRTRCGS